MADLDLDRLMTDADAVTVARSIGMQVFKRGNHYFSYCPIHRERTGADDVHATNFVLSEKGGYCFSCGEFVSIPKMVTGFLGCRKNEAFDLIADAMGGRTFYAADKSSQRCTSVRIPLTAEETALLGLENQNITRITGKGETVYEGLSILYREDPEMYKKIIRDRALLLRKKLQAVLTNYCSPDTPGAQEAYRLFGKEKYEPGILKEIRHLVTDRIAILDRVIAKV